MHQYDISDQINIELCPTPLANAQPYKTRIILKARIITAPLATTYVCTCSAFRSRTEKFAPRNFELLRGELFGGLHKWAAYAATLRYSRMPPPALPPARVQSLLDNRPFSLKALNALPAQRLACRAVSGIRRASGFGCAVRPPTARSRSFPNPRFYPPTLALGSRRGRPPPNWTNGVTRPSRP